MDQQIVNFDPRLAYNAAISTGHQHFKMETNTNITAIQIVARLWIVMLDDTVLSLKILSIFDKT